MQIQSYENIIVGYSSENLYVTKLFMDGQHIIYTFIINSIFQVLKQNEMAG